MNKMQKIMAGSETIYNRWLAGSLCLLMSGCAHIPISLEHTEGDIQVEVIIDWEGEPEDRLPQGMDVYWFPQGYGNVWSTEFNDRRGGYDYLYADVFVPLCLDYEGNENLLLRSDGTPEGMQVYNRTPDVRPVYCDSVTPLPGEVVALEAAAPYAFYVDSERQEVDAKSAQWNDTLKVYFRPRNVLREYSFMIYGIEGAENMIRCSGAISGMSASYRPFTGELAASPTTILFTRTEAIRNGQNGRPGRPWTESEKAVFAAKNPNWDDPETGWTGDWFIGYFSTFGPLNTHEHRYRLTVEAYSTGNNYYYGAWGYWHGEWEDEKPLSIAEQIERATGDMNAPAEQRLAQQEAWRMENGGFDILLYNDSHLPYVPNDAPSSSGGFDLDIDPWGDIIDVNPTGARAATTRAATPLRTTSAYTAQNLPGFVINGIINRKIGDYEYFWNEQYVYRTEEGLFDYQPHKYWSPEAPEGGGLITFFAYAPLSPAGLTTGLKDQGIDGTPPSIVYTTLPPGHDPTKQDVVVDRNNSTDLLVAVQQINMPASGLLHIYFRHALASLQVQTRMGVDVAQAISNNNNNIMTVRITSLVITNLDSSAKLQLDPDDIGIGTNESIGIPMGRDGFRYAANAPVILWDSICHSNNYLFADECTFNKDNTDSTRYDMLYIIPQTTSSYTKVKVNYRINNGDIQTVTLDLPSTSFEIGRSHRLKLKSKIDASNNNNVTFTWDTN
jgi:hypothetical protein